MSNRKQVIDAIKAIGQTGADKVQLTLTMEGAAHLVDDLRYCARNRAHDAAFTVQVVALTTDEGDLA